MLLDDKGWPLLDIFSNPFRQDKPTEFTNTLWDGAHIIGKLENESVEICERYCQQTIEMLLNGKGFAFQRHRSAFQYTMDNFIVVPSPKYDMSWLERKTTKFYYNFPYFVCAVYSLTGKMISSLEQ